MEDLNATVSRGEELYTVLRSANQCSPLMVFDPGMISPFNPGNFGNMIVERYHDQLQQLVDECFSPPTQFPHGATPVSSFGAFSHNSEPRALVQPYFPTPDFYNTAGTFAAQAGHSFAVVASTPNGSLSQSAFIPASGTQQAVARRVSLTPRHGHSSCTPTAFGTGVHPSAAYGDPSIGAGVTQRPNQPTVQGDIKTHQNIVRRGTTVAAAVEIATLHYIAPETVASSGSFYDFVRLGTFSELSQECAICLDPLMRSDNGKLVQLKRCGHRFHLSCIQAAIESDRQCPTCRAWVESHGNMPSSSMVIKRSPNIHCRGFGDVGSIVVEYKLPFSVQKVFHSNPGPTRGGRPCRTVAYLPDNDDGLQLLKRLQVAFSRGLTFYVGPEIEYQHTKMKPLIWAISHKTAGFHFPDPTCFANCHKELDALGVPPATELKEWIPYM